MTSEEMPFQQCGACGTEDGPLFFIPGGWGWHDDFGDGRVGLCVKCGTSDARYRERFREHFGDIVNIVHVSDSDSAGGRDASAGLA